MSGPAVLETRGLTERYGEVPAVTGLDGLTSAR